MIKTFVIHLARATARREQVQRLLDGSPWEAEILPACDGTTLGAEADRLYPGKVLHAPRYPFVLSKGEIACFESHRRAWQKIVDEGLEAGFILEDDADYLPNFTQAAAFAEKHLAAHGYIQFQVTEMTGPEVLADGGVRLLRPKTVPLSASAQLVSRDAAKALLALTETFDRPIDTFLQMVWVTEMPIVCVVPSGVRDVNAQSTLSRKRSLGQKIAAEWKRFRYRAAVSRLSK